MAIANVNVKSSGLLQKYLHKVQNLKTVAEVGFFEEATYPDGTPVAYVAYLNEFGNHNPPRPFMKRTFDKSHPAWVKLIERVLSARGLSQASMKEAFGQAGITAAGDIKKTIMKWNPNDPRPNKPATIKAKMRKSADVKGKNQVKNDPYRVLHDTGVMVNSVVCKVDGNEVK